MLRRRLTRGGLVLLALALVVVGSVGGYALYELDRIHRVVVHGLNSVARNGRLADVENILLVGSTSRCAITPAKHLENFHTQCVDYGVTGVNSDVVMILRLDAHSHSVRLLSIPRDIFVPGARSGNLSNKIDAALADGPSQLVAAIEQDFGIPLNHYIVLNFGSFVGVVDALGGISMDFPTTIYDSESGLDVNRTGCVHLSGLETLALVRARHMNYHFDKATGAWLGYDGNGDLGRIERVHLFLRALAGALAKRGISSPTTDYSLISTLAPNLTLDSTFGDSELVHLILAFHSVNIGSAPELTLPTVNDSQTYSYKGYSYGDVIFPSEPQDQQAIDAFMGDKPDGLALLPARITVSVLGAVGDSLATATTAAALKDVGYRVIGTSERTPVGPISETMVVYHGRQHLAEAQRVMASLSGIVVLSDAPTAGGADVTVVTGSSFVVNRSSAVRLAGAGPVAPRRTPAVGATPGATFGATSATTNGGSVSTADPASTASAAAAHRNTVASSDGGALAAPTAASSPAPAFDPRSCPLKG